MHRQHKRAPDAGRRLIGRCALAVGALGAMATLGPALSGCAAGGNAPGTPAASGDGAVVGEAGYRVLSALPGVDGRGGPARLEVRLPPSLVQASDAPVRPAMCELADPAHVLAEPFYDGLYRFRDPVPWRADPQAEPRWHYGAYQLDADGQWLRWDSRLSVLGWQRISTPAAVFDALAVRRDIRFDHPERSRRANERTEWLWYSPVLGLWVRREWRGHFLWHGSIRQREEEDWARFDLLQLD